jgi:hypothetical protein
MQVTLVRCKIEICSSECVFDTIEKYYFDFPSRFLVLVTSFVKMQTRNECVNLLLF